jgi:hypothetical protein
MKRLMFAVIAAVAVGALVTPAKATDTRLTVQAMSVNGTTPTYTTSLSSTSTNYYFRNDGKTFLHFKKTGAGACTVTVVTQTTVGGFALADLTVSVAATTGDVMIGPFPASIFDDSNGDVWFSISDALSLGVATLKL